MDLPKRLISKQWQDRIKAYEELGELLVRDNVDAVTRYAPYFKRMVADTANPRAQEAALSTLVSVLSHLSAQRTCPSELRNQAADVSLALIDKCLAGRSTTKEKAIHALLLFMQIGALESILNQLIKGCQNKVAKVAASCLFCLKEAIRLFGSPPIPLEPVLPVLKASFDHSVQEVRTEALQVTVELHTWLGSSFNSSIQEMQLRPAQVKELEAAFEARATRDPSPPTPERKILTGSNSKLVTRLTQPVSTQLFDDDDMHTADAELDSSGVDNNRESSDCGVSSESSSDFSDNSTGNGMLLTSASAATTTLSTTADEGSSSTSSSIQKREWPTKSGDCPTINLLVLLTPDWYKDVSTGIWQKRKEQLDNLISWCGNSQRLQPAGDYTKLVRTLRDILGDSATTTVVAASAVRAMSALAKGLGRDFVPYARKLVPIVLDEFKKKSVVVAAVIHEALDDMHTHCFSISDMTSEVGEGMTNKVPRVRSECLKWIARCVANTQGATVLNPTPLSEYLLKCVDDSQAGVRDAAYAVLSLLCKYHGDGFTQELADGGLDRARLSKLKETTRSGSGISLSSSSGSGSSSGDRSPAPASRLARPRSYSRGSTPSSSSTTPSSSSTNEVATPYTTPNHRPSSSSSLTPSKARMGSLNITSSSSSSSSSSSPSSSSPPARSSSLSSSLSSSSSSSSIVMTQVKAMRESVIGLRTAVVRQLESLEIRLDESEARAAEDHQFAADVHAWNVQLLDQHKADQLKIHQLEDELQKMKEMMMNKDVNDEDGDDKDEDGGGRLPSEDELQAMSPEKLNELERRQEDYLLTIRKIKIRLIR